MLVASVLRMFRVADKSYRLLIPIPNLDKKGAAPSRIMNSRMGFPNSKMEK